MAGSPQAQDVSPDTHAGTMTYGADQFAQMGVRMAAVFKSAADESAAFMADPTMQNWLAICQRNVTTIATTAIDRNARAIAELFRLSDPTAVFEGQQTFMSACRDAALESGKAMHLATSHIYAVKSSALPQAGPRPGTHAKADLHYVADVMSPGVRVASSEDTVQHVARIMREENSGTIAVAENDRIVGIVTDHDIAVRMVAEGRDASATKIGEVMTPETRYIFEDVKVDKAAANMIEQQVSSLPVVTRKKRLVGMVSLVDLAPQDHSTVMATRKMNGQSHKSTLHAQLAAGE